MTLIIARNNGFVKKKSRKIMVPNLRSQLNFLNLAAPVWYYGHLSKRSLQIQAVWQLEFYAIQAGWMDLSHGQLEHSIRKLN